MNKEEAKIQNIMIYFERGRQAGINTFKVSTKISLQTYNFYVMTLKQRGMPPITEFKIIYFTDLK